MHEHIKERKEIPNDVKFLTLHFCYADAYRCHFMIDATVVRWLFMPFSLDFLVIPIKNSDTSVKYKILLNLTHHKHKPQSSLA